MCVGEDDERSQVQVDRRGDSDVKAVFGVTARAVCDESGGHNDRKGQAISATGAGGGRAAVREAQAGGETRGGRQSRCECGGVV